MSEAVRLPLADGSKVIVIVQETPVATELPQLLVWVKSLEFAPATAMLVTLKAVLPEFVRVTPWEALGDPRALLVKARLVLERMTVAVAAAAADAAVPDKAAD